MAVLSLFLAMEFGGAIFRRQILHPLRVECKGGPSPTCGGGSGLISSVLVVFAN